jgi:DNA repair protein RadA
MAQSLVELELDELEGVGPATRKKLMDAGVYSILDLAVSLPDELADRMGSTKETTSALIQAAHRLLVDHGFIEKEFVLASEIYDKRRVLQRVSTGSKALDNLLKGGIETQAITELWGEFGSGKTQIAHNLCVMAQLPKENGGLMASSIYVDTESTFRPERIAEIAEGLGLNPKDVLDRIFVCKAYNASHLELMVGSLGRMIEEHGVKLLIIDSIISLHRAEFTGRGTLAERQQRLNALIHRLLRIAEYYNIAVVVTNQVQAAPDVFFGDPTKPAGGHVLGHACTYRIHLRKAGADRIAYMVDSPYHPYSEARFTITPKGIVDAEPKKKE